nr:hypothetical protein [uncultured Desulfobacter sp.]
MAIIEANLHPGKDWIGFGILSSLEKRIVLIWDLPEITDPVIIDGTSRAIPNWPLCVVSGNGKYGGLLISAGNSEI